MGRCSQQDADHVDVTGMAGVDANGRRAAVRRPPKSHRSGRELETVRVAAYNALLSEHPPVPGGRENVASLRAARPGARRP
jgi:hypothetical protein